MNPEPMPNREAAAAAPRLAGAEESPTSGPSDPGGIERAVELSWDKMTTPLEAVERALYALADQVTGTIADGDRHWMTTLHPRGHPCDVDALRHRLRQEVNDQTLRVRIAEQTAPTRNLIFALAFSRSGLVDEGDDR